MQAPSRLSDLSIDRKVLTALRFFGSGSYESDIGCHVYHAVSQASMSRCIEEKIFKNSPGSEIEDSGYALRPWVMTLVPYAAPSSPEERYNERHRSTRSTIERCNGVLKLRFRCLLKHRTLYYKPEKCSYIINACTVLHNICIDHNIPPVEIGQDEGDHYLGEIDFGIYLPARLDENNPAGRINPELAAGRRGLTRILVPKCQQHTNLTF
ncbi:hypothetical protein NQ314_003530 [Rhamnusium bicolor]|uniref:DDE Tnp4 domain-containing protein n=1 Tax=Rhamnusium bicolor TaxID=1586634 RepID=A0AAV8ZNG9_9CUCU|nr:hypothetical protein NQ314_003530 [Rhamnusium bicolor]